MTIRITLGDGLDDLAAADRDGIMTALEGARGRASARLELSDGQITVIGAPHLVMPERGMGSRTLDRHAALIALDPGSATLRAPERELSLGALLSYALYRLARARHPASGWTPGRGFCATLGKALLSEGLALHFEEEMGFPRPPQAVAVERDPLWDLGTRAMAAFDDPHIDGDAWFHGRPADRSFPPHSGASLGYALVRAWLLLSETLPSEELGLESNEVLSAWRTGRLDI